MDMKCELCRFFGPYHPRATEGICRAYAPRPRLRSAAVTAEITWPHVDGADWCGEWEARPIEARGEPMYE